MRKDLCPPPSVSPSVQAAASATPFPRLRAASPTVTVDGQLPVATFTVDPAPGGLSPAIFLAASPGDPPIGIDTGFTFDLDARGVTADTLVEFVCIGSDGFAVPFFFAGELVLSAEFTAVAAPAPPPEFLITIGADGVITIPAGDTSGATPQVSFDSAGTVTLATTLDETAGVFTMTLPPGLPTPGVGLMFVCLDDDGNTVPFLPNGLTEPVTSFTVPFFRAPPARCHERMKRCTCVRGCPSRDLPHLYP